MALFISKDGAQVVEKGNLDNQLYELSPKTTRHKQEPSTTSVSPNLFIASFPLQPGLSARELD
jgi:hypothetical protein